MPSKTSGSSDTPVVEEAVSEPAAVADPTVVKVAFTAPIALVVDGYGELQPGDVLPVSPEVAERLCSNPYLFSRA